MLHDKNPFFFPLNIFIACNLSELYSFKFNLQRMQLYIIVQAVTLVNTLCHICNSSFNSVHFFQNSMSSWEIKSELWYMTTQREELIEREREREIMEGGSVTYQVPEIKKKSSNRSLSFHTSDPREKSFLTNQATKTINSNVAFYTKIYL